MVETKRKGAAARRPCLPASVAAGILVLAAGAAWAQGLTGMLPFFPPGEEVTDAVKAHYHFKVVANQSPGGKILFGSNRFYGTGPETYLTENNFYSNGLLYADEVCTSWPLEGMPTFAVTTLRVAVPDYNLHGKTGARTFAPADFPRQSYNIDTATGAPKTDMISQFDLTGREGTVEISRGDIVTDHTGWKCSGPLDASVYRQWNVVVTVDGVSYPVAFALPDDGAHYFTPYEILNFYTEFFQHPGLFKVHFWKLEVQRENSTTWIPLRWFRVHNDAPTNTEWGVRITTDDGIRVLEVSNDAPADFFGDGATFMLPTPVCGDGIVDGSEQCDDGNTLDGDCCSSTCQFDPAGSACTDGVICTEDACDGAGTCTHHVPPVAGCDGPQATKATLTLKKNARSATADALEWKWVSGGPFDAGALGTPATTTDLTLCVFDQTGKAVAATAPAGGQCAGKPCWRTSATTVKYSDKALTPDGLQKLQGKSGAAGRGKLEVKGKGASLRMPSLGLTTPVTARLLRGDGPGCWEATFASHVQKNLPTEFRAKSE